MDRITRTFDHATYCDLLEEEAHRFAAAAVAVAPETRVPSCPEWTVAELIEHVGDVHRWAREHVRRLSQIRLRSADLDLDQPVGPDAYGDWLRAGVATLLETLRAADPDAEVWAWGADKHVRFWPRRMLHETTIHRADLEIAAGAEPIIERTVAVDGIDEFLENLPHAVSFRPEVQNLRGRGETIVLGATDTDETWTIRLEPDGFVWDDGDAGEARVRVLGPVTSLLLFSYGRETDASRAVAIDGDVGLVEFWRARSAL